MAEGVGRLVGRHMTKIRCSKNILHMVGVMAGFPQTAAFWFFAALLLPTAKVKNHNDGTSK